MSEIEILERIGGGAFGQVHRGRFVATEVAVKLGRGHRAARTQTIPREEDMLAARHPNVRLFMGACFDNARPHWALVTEYISKGSLWDCCLRDEAIAPGPSAWYRVGAGVRAASPLHAHASAMLQRRQVAERLGGCGDVAAL